MLKVKEKNFSVYVLVKNSLDFFKCLRDTTIQYKLTNKVKIGKIAFYTKMEIKLVEKLRSVTIWFFKLSF